MFHSLSNIILFFFYHKAKSKEGEHGTIPLNTLLGNDLIPSHDSLSSNEWRDPSPQLSAWTTQLQRNIAAVASRWWSYLFHMPTTLRGSVSPWAPFCSTIQILMKLTFKSLVIKFKNLIMTQKACGLLQPLKQDMWAGWVSNISAYSFIKKEWFLKTRHKANCHSEGSGLFQPRSFFWETETKTKIQFFLTSPSTFPSLSPTLSWIVAVFVTSPLRHMNTTGFDLARGASGRGTPLFALITT